MRKRKSKEKVMSKEDILFLKSIQNMKLPILTLDPAWHALFVNDGKSREIKELEKKMMELLKQQGRLNDQNKQMQHQKKRLMNNILQNMSDSRELSEKKKLKQKELIEDINVQVVKNEDALGELPVQIERVNEELLLETFKSVYGQIDSNRERIGELDGYIERIRNDLTNKLLEKQSRQSYNDEVFSSLNGIVGREAVDLFDRTHETKKNNK